MNAAFQRKDAKMQRREEFSARWTLHAATVPILVVDKRRPERLLARRAAALAPSTPRRHAERPLAGLFFTALGRLTSYVTKAIPKKQLERKLHEAVRLARARLEDNLSGRVRRSTTT